MNNQMKISKLSCAIAAAISLLSSSFGAQASIIQLPDPSAMTTSFVNDFELVVNAGPVTFNAGTFLETACSAAECVTSSGVRGLLSGSFPDTITATLSGSYGSVGMYFGNDDECCSSGFSAVLSAYSGVTLLGSVSVAANMDDGANQFIGLASTIPFDKVVISYSGASLFVFIDDFRVGQVPEPSTIALIGMALLSMFGFGMMRRRAEA